MKLIQTKRLWELDALRGVAIILMVIYHLVYNLDLLFGIPLNATSGFWYYEGRFSAILFIMLVGAATSLIAKRYEKSDFWKKQLKRSVKLIFWGIMITLATYLTYPNQTIWFGILHFMAIGILITSLFAKRIWLHIILAPLFFIFNDPMAAMDVNHYYGIMLGFKPANFQSFDYYPLFPYLAWMMLGIAAGNLIYRKKGQILSFQPNKSLKILAWIGQKSLWIYLIHQPVLLGILWLFLR